MTQKFYIKWGKKPNLPRLSAVQKKALKDKLNKRAAEKNGFLITLTEAEYLWLKEHAGNAIVEVFMRGVGSGNSYWVAVGADKDSIHKARQGAREGI
jgi:hypothetical protein